MTGREGLHERLARRATAHGRLLAAIGAVVDGGGRVPCLSTTQGRWWTSEDAGDLEAAARSCAGCEALAACRRYVEQHPETSGVWAGRIPNERKTRK